MIEIPVDLFDGFTKPCRQGYESSLDDARVAHAKLLLDLVHY
jgi:hypothetical protein